MSAKHHDLIKHRTIDNVQGYENLLVTDNVPSSPILVTVIMETLRSSETSVLTRATRRGVPEDGILHMPCVRLRTYF
jgi:hypothetical protein